MSDKCAKCRAAAVKPEFTMTKKYECGSYIGVFAQGKLFQSKDCEWREKLNRLNKALELAAGWIEGFTGNTERDEAAIEKRINMLLTDADRELEREAAG